MTRKLSATKPTPNDGAIRLDRYIYRRRITQQMFADEMGVTAPTVNRWLAGSLIPSEASATLLEKATSIPAGAWRRPARVAS
jgi:transcriptional regulator with XRE-family HTH domain